MVSGNGQRKSRRTERATFKSYQNWWKQSFWVAKKEKRISSGFGPHFMHFRARFRSKWFKKSDPGAGITFFGPKWRWNWMDHENFQKTQKFKPLIVVCNRSYQKRFIRTGERSIWNFENPKKNAHFKLCISVWDCGICNHSHLEFKENSPKSTRFSKKYTFSNWSFSCSNKPFFVRPVANNN